MGRQALHSPCPAASASTTTASPEEEGLHARALPHILEMAFNVVSVDFGGGRIGTFSLPPHTDGDFLGGGGVGPPPHNVGVYFGEGGTGPPPHILYDFSPFLKRDFDSVRLARKECNLHSESESLHSTETGKCELGCWCLERPVWPINSRRCSLWIPPCKSSAGVEV